MQIPTDTNKHTEKTKTDTLSIIHYYRKKTLYCAKLSLFAVLFMLALAELCIPRQRDRPSVLLLVTATLLGIPAEWCHNFGKQSEGTSCSSCLDTPPRVKPLYPKQMCTHTVSLALSLSFFLKIPIHFKPSHFIQMKIQAVGLCNAIQCRVQSCLQMWIVMPTFLLFFHWIRNCVDLFIHQLSWCNASNLRDNLWIPSHIQKAFMEQENCRSCNSYRYCLHTLRGIIDIRM